MEMSSRTATWCFVVVLGFQGRVATASLGHSSKSQNPGQKVSSFFLRMACVSGFHSETFKMFGTYFTHQKTSNNKL